MPPAGGLRLPKQCPVLGRSGFRTAALKLGIHQNDLEGLPKHRLLGPQPRVSDSVGVGRAAEFNFLRIFPGSADALVQEPLT